MLLTAWQDLQKPFFWYLFTPYFIQSSSDTLFDMIVFPNTKIHINNILASLYQAETAECHSVGWRNLSTISRETVGEASVLYFYFS